MSMKPVSYCYRLVIAYIIIGNEVQLSNKAISICLLLRRLKQIFMKMIQRSVDILSKEEYASQFIVLCIDLLFLNR